MSVMVMVCLPEALDLDFGARALGAMAIPMSAGNTKRQMMCMEDLGATAFACTPSYALYLAESIQEAGDC